MIDNLIQHLLEEIAMDGNAGTDVSRLSSFIVDYFSTQHDQQTQAAGAGPSSSSSEPTPQTIDPAFLSFVWDTLVAQEDVHVGVLSTVASKPKVDRVDEEQKEETPATMAVDGATGEEGEQPVEGSPAPSASSTADKGKGKAKEDDKKGKKKKGKGSGEEQVATHEFRVLKGEEKEESRESLLERYGEDLRIAVGAQTAWIAITGSSMRPGSLTASVYSMLQLVSRGRGDGATVVEIGQQCGFDQRSCFHFVKVAVGLGIVKKFRTIDLGSWTNRILHVRYLSVSPHWAVFTASDAFTLEDESNAAEGGGGSDDDEGGKVVSASVKQRMTPISRMHLASNRTLVRQRIVKALKRRDQRFMPHHDVAAAIGLYNHTRKDLRRLNDIINGLCADEVIEKTLVEQPSRKRDGNIVAVQCVRLLDENATGREKKKGKKGEDDDEELEEEVEDDEPSHALAIVPIERQIIDLLAESDTDGLTNYDLASALGGYTSRTIDQTLVRLSRPGSFPPHLADFTLHVSMETFGREKRSRWFTIPGYLRRCAKDGLTSGKEVDAYRKILEDEETIGGWTEARGEKYYKDAKERTRFLNGYDFKKGGRPNGGARKIGRASGKEIINTVGKKWFKKGMGRPKGTKQLPRSESVEQDEEEDDGWEDVDDGEPFKATKTKVPKGPREPKKPKEPKPPKPKKEKPPRAPDAPLGRPRKHPKIEGKETYYERRKREDQERIEQGLPPRQKGEKRVTIPRVKDVKQRASRKKKGESETPAPDEDDATPAPVDDNGDAMDVDQLDEDAGSLPPADNADVPSPAAPSPPPPAAAATPKRPSRSAAAKNGKGKEKEKEVIVMDEDPDPTPIEISTPALPTKKRGRTRQSILPDSPAPVPTPKDASLPPPTPSESSKRKRVRIVSPVREPTPPPAPDAPDDDNEASPAPSPEPEPEPAPVGRQLRRRSGANDSPAKPTPALKPAAPTPTAAPAPTPAKEVAAPAATPSTTTPTSTRKTPSKNFSVEIPVRRGTPVPAPKAMVAPVVAPVEKEQPEAGPSTPAPAANGTQDGEQQKEVEPEGTPIEVDESTPSGTPAPADGPVNRRVGALAKSTGSTTPRRNRTPVAPKNNLTALARQNEILAFIDHQGGVIEHYYGLAYVVRDFIASSRPSSSSAFAMDRKIFVSMADALIYRGLLERTIVMSPARGRIEVLSNPTLVSKDSEAMSDFVRQVVGAPATKRKGKQYQNLTRATDLVLDDDDDGGPLERLDEPELDDDRQLRRSYYARNPLVLGNKFGVHYGRVARARSLHIFLVDWLSQQPDETSEFLFKTKDGRKLLTNSVFTSALTFDVFRRACPLAIDSPTLDAFVAGPASNLALPLSELPTDIHTIVQPESGKRRHGLWIAFQTLIDFGLLRPLVTVDSAAVIGVNKEAFEVPTRAVHATHWELINPVPLYAFEQPTAPLVEVCDITTKDQAETWWSRLHEGAFPPRKDHVRVAPLADDVDEQRFPRSFDGPKPLLKIVTSSTKWHDSYMLLAPQRKFLSKLYKRRVGQENKADTVEALDGHRYDQEDKEVAEDLLAPLETVQAFLWKLDAVRRRDQKSLNRPIKRTGTGKRASKKTAKAPRKRRRVERSDGEEEWEDVTDNEATAVENSNRLKLKSRDALAQREKDFAAIVERFKLAHGQPELNATILEYLRKRFMPGAGRPPIDSKHLDCELRLLLPADANAMDTNDENAPDLSSFKSVVPRSLSKPKDPYALPAGPKIRVVGKKQARAAAPRPQTPAAAPAPQPPQPRAPVPGPSTQTQTQANDKGKQRAVEDDDDDEEYTQSKRPQDKRKPEMASGTNMINRQDEFLSAPARPVPELKPGQRFPRNFFSAEQNDLILDAVAIMKARCDYVDRRIVFTPIEQLFAQIKSSKIRQAFLKLVEAKEDLIYYERLVDAWKNVWETKRGSDELPDLTPDDPVAFKIVPFIRCLRANIDKTALCLAGPLPEARPVVVDLPSTLEDFKTKFVVEPLTPSLARGTAQWSSYWRSTITGLSREAEVNSRGFTVPCVGERRELHASQDRRLALTQACVKMIVSLDEFDHTAEHADCFVKPFEDLLPLAIEDLQENGVISKLQKPDGRRGPGRGYVLAHRYLVEFDSIVSSRKALEARRVVEEYGVAQEEKTWPLIMGDGDMIALFEGVSSGKWNLAIDTDVCAHLRPADDYQTRQLDDEAVECAIKVTLRDSTPTLFPERSWDVLPREGSTDDSLLLDQARESLSEVQQGALQAISWAGLEGLSLSSLLICSPHLTMTSALNLVDSLVNHNPPLVFWAGETVPSLVSYEFPSSWAVLVRPSPTERDEHGKLIVKGNPINLPTRYVFPAFWVDYHGQVLSERLDQAANWVKSWLVGHTGSTFRAIVEHSRSTHFLTLHELLMLFEVLEKWGDIERRDASGVAGEGGTTERLGWEDARWFLKEKWY